MERYKKITKNESYERYENIKGNCLDFDITKKRFKITKYNSSGNKIPKYIDMEELEFVYDICKNKGWL